MGMTLSSVRYSALQQNDIDEGTSTMESPSGFQYGAGLEYFKSAFTYANYNDLDSMGYMTSKKHGNQTGNRYSKFTFTKSYNIVEEDEEEAPLNTLEKVIVCISLFVLVCTMPFSLIFALKFIGTTEQLVILRLGKARRPCGSGTVLVIPCIDRTQKIDTRITAFNVPPLQIITYDRGLIEVGATVFLRVRDVIAAVCAVEDRNKSTRTLAQTMLYRYICKKRICEIQKGEDRRMLGADLKDELGSFTSQFGVEITEVQLSEVKVIKGGENMGMAALSSVAKSEIGQQLWSVIGPTLDEIVKEGQAQQQENECACPSTPPSDPMQPGTSEDSHADFGDLIDVSEPDVDVDNLVTIINMAIDETLTKAVNRIFQINCRGLDPLYIDLKHGRGRCVKGTAPDSDVVFEMDQRVFDELLRQKLSPMSAYMAGSLKIKGSIQDALSLKYLAERVTHLL